MQTVSARSGDAAELVGLLADQAKGLHELDDRLATPLLPEQYEKLIGARQGHDVETRLVVRDDYGRVVGFGEPRVQVLPEGHGWLGFAPRVGGVWNVLAISAPGSSTRGEALVTLVEAARDMWKAEGLTGEYIRWPSMDRRLMPAMAELGLVASGHYAYARPDVSFPPGTGEGLCRPAESEDYPTVWHLRSEQAEYELQHARFQVQGTLPNAEPGFRRHFERALDAGLDEDLRPQISVMEWEGSVIGFVEAEVQTMAAGNPSHLPEGRYGYIDNAGVVSSARGRGLGRDLLEYARTRLAEKNPRGLVLWYFADNPLASRFWTQLGFRSLITRFERRYDPPPKCHPAT